MGGACLVATEYQITSLPDRLRGSRDVRANRLLATRAREGWELVRVYPMRVLGCDVGLYFVFRRGAGAVGDGDGQPA